MPIDMMTPCAVLAQLAEIEDPPTAFGQALSLTRQEVGADLILVLKCHNQLAVQCVGSDPYDPISNLLTMGSVCETALGDGKPEFIEDYRSGPQANRLLTSWGAVSAAILPIRSEPFTGAVLVAWKQKPDLGGNVRQFLLSMLSYFRIVLPHGELTKQLSITQDRLSSILKSIPQGVVFVDADGLEGWTNAPAGRMLRLPQGGVTPLQVSAALRDLRHAAQPDRTSEEPVIEISTLSLDSDSLAGQLWVLNDVTKSFQQSRQLQEKTQQLTAANEDLQAGKQLLEEKVSERTKALAEAVEQLQTRNEDLRRSEERLRLVMDVTGLGIWDWDLISGKLDLTDLCRAAFGMLPNAPVRLEDVIAAIHPEDRGHVQETIEAALNPAGDGEYRADYRSIGVVDHVLRCLHSEGRVFFAGSGAHRRAVRFVGATQNVTTGERAKTALLRANSDLRQFAYAAAHDLQEPLRNISTSLGLLKRNLKGRLDGETAELIDESMEGAQRMHRMVKDLLSFTTITERLREVQSAPVDAQAVLEQTLKNLSRSIAEAAATITCDPLPCVEMEETHLLQLFQNLISNSLKYRRSDVLLQIHVGAERHPGEWRFVVADNGIGFDPIYAQRIFGIFKRLHGRGDYPGNGIGLAICSRIVASYGGSVWAEGEPDAGARFFFTVPIQQREVR